MPRRGQFSRSDQRTLIKVREPPQILSFDASRVICNQAAKDHYPSHPLRQRTQGFMCGKMVLPLPATRRLREPSFPIPSTISSHLGEKQGGGKEICKGKEFYLPKLGSVYHVGSNLIDKIDFVSPLPSNKLRACEENNWEMQKLSVFIIWMCVINFYFTMSIMFSIYFSILFYHLNVKNFNISPRKSSG